MSATAVAPATETGADQTIGRVQTSRLKAWLVIADATAIFLGTAVALLLRGYPGRQGYLQSAAVVGFALVAGLWAVRSQGLLLARVSVIRVVEFTRAVRATVILAALMLVFDRVFTIDLYVREAALIGVLSFVFIVINRSVYRAWLATQRRRGRYIRKIVMVGTDAEAARIIELFETHGEAGFEVVGVIGNQGEAYSRGLGLLWLGDICNAEELIASAGASGVVVSPSALVSERLNNLVRSLLARNVHVHLATGISGIDSKRLQSVPVAHEPMLYVEAPSLGRVQVVAKRTFDIVASVLAVAITAPIMLVVAIVIKLHDRGPVLFRQERVGQGGAIFKVLKFRTMTVDAEAQLTLLSAVNERNGPLFKMTDDPRVTRVGRFLRDSSLDELPQLFNVVRGQMSLVGPRPALPSEVAKFSPELRAREQVQPGVTGLWQVDARDNPSFEEYRRLDLFYVENWSITLDLMIIIGTIEHLIVRLFGSMRPNRDRSSRDSHPTAGHAMHEVA